MPKPEMTEEKRRFAAEIAAWMRKEFGWEEGKETPLWKDDWTFIVKLHAMIETGLNGAIARELERPSLAPIIAKLDTSNGSTGKVAFAKALGILDPTSAVFLQKLSELRNICVHDIRHFRFNLIDHLTAIGDKKRREVLKTISKVVTPEHRISCPHEGLLIGAMGIMMQLMVHDQQCRARALEEALLRTKAKLFAAQNQSTPRE